jgi:hypothetical protein
MGRGTSWSIASRTRQGASYLTWGAAIGPIGLDPESCYSPATVGSFESSSTSNLESVRPKN